MGLGEADDIKYQVFLKIQIPGLSLNNLKLMTFKESGRLYIKIISL
jgi:hypothetical protein